MKEVMTDIEPQTLVTRLILDALYTRLTEYSTLVYSKHQRAIHDDLKTAPQFTISIKDLDFNGIKCTAKDMETVLNFFACFENDNNSPDGIYYEKMQDEYVIQTKTEANTMALETILWNIKNMPNVRIDKLYQGFTDISKKDKLIKIFRRKGVTSSFLGLFDVKQIERTEIQCLYKRQELEMFHRRRLETERREQAELEEERVRVVRENAIRQEVEQKHRQYAQNGGMAKRDRSLPGRTKVQAIKPMFSKYFNPNLNPHKVALLIENALISISSNPPSLYYHINEIKEKLNKNSISKQDFASQKREIIIKFANTHNMQPEGAEVLLEYITVRNGDIHDLIYDYCRELWKGDKM